MRLKKEHIESIKNIAIDTFGNNVSIYLFGSRVDDSKKGGDIDLYLETDTKEELFEKKIAMLTNLKKAIGEQKIDLVINNFSTEKFIFKVAKEEGILL